MAKDQYYSIVGPTGTLLYELSEAGLKDVPRNRLFNPFDQINVPLLVGTLSSFVWTCFEGIWQVAGVQEAHTVAGGSGATVMVVACPQKVAIASGVAQLGAAIDLTVAAPAGAFPALIASPTKLTRGDALAILMAGTQTGLVGTLSILINRIGL